LTLGRSSGKILKRLGNNTVTTKKVPHLTDRYDVAVIGSGPAGSTAAKRCSELGLRTILIEKNKIPRSKPCGGGVSLKALKQIGHRIPESLIDQQVRGFRFYSKSLASVTMKSEVPVGITTTRDRFDAFLTKLAVDSGCKLLQSDELTDISIHKEGVLCKLRSNDFIMANIVIGADGANGIVAQKSGIRQKWKNDEIGLCLETTVPLEKSEMEKIDPDILELYFSDIPFGYGWLFPKRFSISLGIGGALASLHKPMGMLADFCRTISDTKRIKLQISGCNAHLAPAGGFKRNIVTDRIMLVGDAAGFIDPFTGEGIYYAIRSGHFAALACIQSIENDMFGTDFLEKNYARICNDDFGKDLRVALFLSYRIHEHFDTFFDALQHSSSSTWSDLAIGKTTYRKLQKKLLPKLLLRLVKRRIEKVMEPKKGEKT
jgi:geranylgeranyl reductase family protein